MEFELNYDKDTLLQKHLEAWSVAFKKHSIDPKEGDMTAVQYRGAMAKSGIAAGWVKGYDDPSAVSEWLPRDVRKLATLVDNLYAEATGIDPN